MNSGKEIPQTKDDSEAVESYDRDMFALTTVALLAFFCTVPFLFLEFTVADIVSLNLSKIFSYRLLFFLLIPIPISYVAAISRERFRWESFAALTSLLLLPLGYRFIVISSTIFFGSLITSFASSRVYNEDHKVRSFYKAASYTFLFLALVSASLFVYLYNARPGWRTDIQNAAANNTKKIAMSLPFDLNDMSNLTSGEVKDIKKNAIQQARNSLQQRISQLNLSEKKTKLLKRKLNLSDRKITGQLIGNLNLSKQNTLGKVDFRPFFQEIFAPGLKINVLIFLFVFSLAALFRYLFSSLASLYSNLYLWLSFSRD